MTVGKKFKTIDDDKIEQNRVNRTQQEKNAKVSVYHQVILVSLNF